MVSDDDADTATVKSKPVPASAAVATVVPPELTVREPVCKIAEAGAKTTPTVQLAPGARLGPHVLLVRVNPAATESARPVML
jgi:hypothetical protein